MTFKKFQNLVLEHCPNVESVAPHGSGDFGGGAARSVAVVFKTGRQQLYFYSGSYWHILQRLGANIAARSYINYITEELRAAEAEHGKPSGLFGKIADNSEKIEYLRRKLELCNRATIIEDE